MSEILGHYELQHLLGKGGMGEVHLARDTRLDRSVALKLLPPALADDPERRARFLREARAAAALNHPNITTTLDVGQVEGRDYIAQEFLEGRTLADVIASERLSTDELVRLAVPLADALAYAHERGVIHRDLKPANVMVTERGHPMLLDFGLAKMLLGERLPGEADSTTLTLEGAVFGTPSAMSPEQALGRSVDARSDIFSFGSLLYEMAAARPAFAGATLQETLDQVIHAEPDPLGRLRPDLPDGYLAVVAKALRKDAGERYQSMTEVAADLSHLKRQTDSGLVPPAVGRSGSRAPWAGLVAALVLVAAVFVWAPWRSDADPRDGGGAAPSATSAAGAFVAVMSFEDPGGDGEDGLGRMLAHLVTTELSSGGELDMLSQQRLYETALALGAEDGRIDRANASAVAREAGVATMLLGQVSRVGAQLLATVSLVDVDTGADRGSAQARGDGDDDLFAMAESLGQQVRIALGGMVPRDTASLEQQLTSSVPAYRAYVRGLELFHRRDFQASADAFEEATERDPAFATAYYQLAIVLQWMAGNAARTQQAMERALAFRERLPGDLGEHIELFVATADGRYDDALEPLRRVTASDPANFQAHLELAEMYLHSSRHADSAEAVRLFTHCFDLDPDYGILHDHIVHSLIFAGRLDEAEARLDAWDLDEDEDGDLRRRVASFRGDVAELQRLADLDVGRSYRVPGPFWTFARNDLQAKLLSLRENASAFGVLFDHSLVAMLGRFDEMREGIESHPRPDREEPTYDWDTNRWVRGHLLLAGALELAGRQDGAAFEVADVVATQPGSPRVRLISAGFALRRGDLETAEADLDALRALEAEGLHELAGLYRRTAEAAWLVEEGRATEAVELLAPAIDEANLLADWWSYNASAGPYVRLVLARALEEAGRPVEALTAVRELMDARSERSAVVPGLVELHARFLQGRLELAHGDREVGQAALREVIDLLGEADWPVPLVDEARVLLGG